MIRGRRARRGAPGPFSPACFDRSRDHGRDARGAAASAPTPAVAGKRRGRRRNGFALGRHLIACGADDHTQPEDPDADDLIRGDTARRSELLFVDPGPTGALEIAEPVAALPVADARVPPRDGEVVETDRVLWRSADRHARSRDL